MCKSIRRDKSTFAKAAQEAHLIQDTVKLKRRWNHVVPDGAGAQRFAGKGQAVAKEPLLSTRTFLH